MSNRAIFALMAVLGAGAIVGLWLLVRGGGDEVADTPAKGSGSATVATNGTTSSGVAPEQPSLPAARPGRVRPDTSQPFKAGDERDHRTGNRAAFEPSDDLPQPGNVRKIQTATTKEVADHVRDAVHDCAKSVPTTARGKDPRLEGAINIAIKDGRVSVNRADLVVKDVTGDPGETVRKCIVDRSKSITQAAPDEMDVESYDITVSFALL